MPSGDICLSARFAALIAARFDSYRRGVIIEGVEKFWLSYEHYDAYSELVEKEKASSYEVVEGPSDMTPEEFLTMLGMEVVEGGDGYAVGA